MQNKPKSQDYLELKKWLDATRDDPLEDMGGFFDRRIGEYEAHMGAWKAHYPWLAEHVPADAETLLDIGCGTGLELDEIFRRLPNIRVLGVDLSHEMLVRLMEKHGDKQLTVAEADYFLYDMGENAFDAAVSFETLHHFTAEKKAEVFRKIFRALRPGGVYLECDYIAVDEDVENLTFAEYARRRRRDGIPGGAFVHFDTPLTVKNEMASMKMGGFSRVECLGFLPHDNHTALFRAVK